MILKGNWGIQYQKEMLYHCAQLLALRTKKVRTPCGGTGTEEVTCKQGDLCPCLRGSILRQLGSFLGRSFFFSSLPSSSENRLKNTRAALALGWGITGGLWSL